MTRPAYATTYGAVLLVMLVLDLLWLGVVARPLYQRGIGHLMLARPQLGVAALFYAVFALGLVLFVVLPHAGDGWPRHALWAALFGFVTYATYDLTNLATLKGWPVGLALLDIAWGCTVCVLAAGAGKLALDHWPRA